MRSAFIFALMAATAVTPVASAAAQDRGQDRRAERQEARAERQQARAERAPQREQRAERAPAPRQVRERSAQNYVAPDRTYQRRGAAIERRGDRRDARVERRDVRDARIRSYDRTAPVARQGTSRSGSWGDNRSRSGSWSHNWRNDRRYDWQRYRNSNRHVYHLGRYYSPYRHHRYNRFSIGLFLGSAFYGQNYWISDPWYYRLPPAYPGTRWVRYYDDVMLVDVYTGEVVDVIYDFFW